METTTTSDHQGEAEQQPSSPSVSTPVVQSSLKPSATSNDPSIRNGIMEGEGAPSSPPVTKAVSCPSLVQQSASLQPPPPPTNNITNASNFPPCSAPTQSTPPSNTVTSNHYSPSQQQSQWTAVQQSSSSVPPVAASPPERSRSFSTKAVFPHALSPIAPSPTRKKQRTSIVDLSPALGIPEDAAISKGTGLRVPQGLPLEDDDDDNNNDNSCKDNDDDQMQTEPEQNDKDESDQDEEASNPKMPARGVAFDHSNNKEEDNHAEEEEEDEEENGGEEVDANLIEMLAQAAAAQGISLEWIIEQAQAEHEARNTQPVEYPFDRLPTNLAQVAEFIQSDKCQRILILAGAGMSVSSGIPDFRSAGTGLYSTLDASALTCTLAQQEEIRQDPSYALDQLLFLDNPLPLLETKRDFILGTYEQRWKATLAHRFVELLHAKTGKLVRLYTQNIDGLEDQCTQLPEDKVIPVHGTMDRAECARCNTRTSFADFCHQVRTQIKDITGRDATAPSVSTAISCPTCGYHALKPAIVLFRSSMPQEFFENVGPDVANVDLLIVIGTSLKVAPANSLVWRVPRSALRVLVNREVVGEHLGMDFGQDETEHDDDNGNNNNEENDIPNNDQEDGRRTTGRDYFASGNCDDVLLELMQHLGWLPDLESLLGDQQMPESCAALLQERLAARADSTKVTVNSVS